MKGRLQFLGGIGKIPREQIWADSSGRLCRGWLSGVCVVLVDVGRLVDW